MPAAYANALASSCSKKESRPEGRLREFCEGVVAGNQNLWFWVATALAQHAAGSSRLTGLPAAPMYEKRTADSRVPPDVHVSYAEAHCGPYALVVNDRDRVRPPIDV